MGRLREEPRVREEYADEINSFATYMLNERGLSPSTIKSQSWVGLSFLISTLARNSVKSLNQRVAISVTRAAWNQLRLELSF